MKRLFAFLVIALFVFSLCACKASQDNGDSDNSEHNHTHIHTSEVQVTESESADTEEVTDDTQMITTEAEQDVTVTDAFYEDDGVSGVLAQKHIDKIDIPFDEEYQAGATVEERIAICNKYTTEWETLAERYYKELLQYKGDTPITENYNTDEQLHSFLEQYKKDWEMSFNGQAELYVDKIENGPDQLGASLVFAQFCYEANRENALYYIGIYEELADFNNQTL